MTKIKTHHEISAVARIIADWRSMMVVHAIYEKGPVRYSKLSNMLELSPTILSGKLVQLTKAGIISRHNAVGSKEVTYQTQPIAKKMVKAYHLLESINNSLKDT